MSFLPLVWEGNTIHSRVHLNGFFQVSTLTFNQNLFFFLEYTYIYSKDKAKDAIFYSYTRHINGFAAILEDEEAAQIASK